MNQEKYYRVSALIHFALGTSKVKVIFRQGGWGSSGKERAYWMNPETYDKVPIGNDLATIENYQKHGEVIEASNTDIYDIEQE